MVVRLEDRHVDADTLTFLRDVGVVLRQCGGRLTVVTDDAFARWALELTLLDRVLNVRGGHRW